MPSAAIVAVKFAFGDSFRKAMEMPAKKPRGRFSQDTDILEF
jgi:hypothetical protein